MSASLQLSFDLPMRVARDRENFFVSPSNKEAVEWIDRWPDWPTHALAICGPAACGKSHLAHVWRARSGAATRDLAKIRRDQPPRNPSLGAVIDYDDGAFDEIALLHFYNTIAQAGGSLLLTAKRPPARWDIALPDLRSRLRTVTVVQVDAPDDELLAAVMAKLFDDRQLAVTPDLISYVVARIERSFEAVHRFVERLDQASLESGRSITVRLAAGLLAGEASEDGKAENAT